MEDQKLMNYFKFDATDLQANRAGQVTEKQKRRMTQDSKSGGILGNPFALLFIFIGLIGFVIAIGTGLAVDDWTFRISFGLGFGCIWPLAWGGIGVRSLIGSSSSSSHRFTIARVQGAAGLDRRQIYDGSWEYALAVGGKRFTAEAGLDQVLTPGAQYVIYYYIRDNLDALVSTKNILSAEMA